MKAGPFVKWAGGKTQLLPALLEVLPPKINTYFEPFIGGGAVFWALANQRRFEKAVLNDINAELILTYRILCTEQEKLIEALRTMKAYHDLQFFYDTRTKDWTKLLGVEAAARFIYLNKTCFNGLYRVNKSGIFNTPWGDRDKSVVLDEVNLRECHRVLKNNVHLSLAGYEAVLKHLQRPAPGDAVYFDPPYLPVKKTSHTSYTQNGFDVEEHRRLAKLFRDLHAQGIYVVASNADLPLTRELYEGFRFIEIKARRSIARLAKDRAPVGELIIVGEVQ